MARKARKFESQGGLILPALELAYTFFAITHTPHEVIVNTMLPVIDDTLKEIVVCERDPLLYQPPYHTTGGIAGSSRAHYWDDFCLAYFLKGICLRYIAYPVRTAFPTQSQSQFQFQLCCVLIVMLLKQDPDAVLNGLNTAMSTSMATEQALHAFGEVLKHGHKIKLDHYILYYTRMCHSLAQSTQFTSYRLIS